MTQKGRTIRITLSTKLSLLVVLTTTTLLVVSLSVMLYYSHNAIKLEALHKADQKLEGTVQHIDNILLSIEQASGNMYFNLLPHLDQPEMMTDFCLEMIKSNPYIAGCAIAFEPYYYKDREFFMTYIYRTYNDSLEFSNVPIIQSDTFGDCPYTQQEWYTTPVKTGKAIWMNPLKGQKIDDPFVTFSLPIRRTDGYIVGVLAIDLSLNQMSHIILAAKPSPNSYAVLLDSDGSFILHPDDSKLLRENVFTEASLSTNHTIEKAAQSMVSGQTGYKPFRQDGKDYYIFYKPFKRTLVPGRSSERLAWSTGIVFPKDDIYGSYNQLFYVVLAITIFGLLLLLVICRTFAHSLLLPLRKLSVSAQRISEGHYDDIIPDSSHHDEIGKLQDNFQNMQRSLSKHVSELEELSNTLHERGIGLRKAYERAQKADRMKTAVLHNMTNQMMVPATTIANDVSTLCDNYESISQEEADRIVTEIQAQGKSITILLKNLLSSSDENKGKEEEYA